MQRTIVITGTDTGVGKTMLMALLVSHLRANEHNVAALKPICSGGREDAHVLHRALGGALTLDEINPWHFRAPLAPLLAARKERQRVRLSEVVAHVRSVARQFEITVIESAGGLLSPLGEDFSTRELIGPLNAEAIIVAPNRLGVINHVRLTLEALAADAVRRARVALMCQQRPDSAARTNPKLIAEFAKELPVATIPWLGRKIDCERALATPQVYRALNALLK